jgi:hypothetical protein
MQALSWLEASLNVHALSDNDTSVIVSEPKTDEASNNCCSEFYGQKTKGSAWCNFTFRLQLLGWTQSLMKQRNKC